MPAYAIGHLRTVAMGPAIVEYLERIDATLEPFGGRFIVHGASPEMLEGISPGTMVVIQFPDSARAHAWYDGARRDELVMSVLRDEWKPE